MTLAEVRKAYPKGKFGKNWFMLDDLERTWYVWPEDRMKGRWDSVLPTTKRPDSTLNAILVNIDATGVTSDQILKALQERWGEPASSRLPSNYEFVGNVTAQHVTIWEDEACDVAASLIEVTRTRVLPPQNVGAALLNVYAPVTDTDALLRLDRKSVLRKKAARAVDAARP